MTQKVMRGVEAKLLQYEDQAGIICDKQINLEEIISKSLVRQPSGASPHCVLINLEKDVRRYHSALEELQKLSISNFVHLKGTYWKNKTDVEQDLTEILAFLKQFNPSIPDLQVVVNEFSEVNDPNIYIQEGPLGCFCSHLRAMIYGYQNFKDYTVIIEDDAFIADTEKIERYLQCIPDDWDIVCLNSIGKNRLYDVPYYKFEDDFHSTHFYIINHRCMPTLFEGMYPIPDQVDVLIAKQVHKLNIYNIPATVYQRNIATNTQNNLHVIFNSPNYEVVRSELENIERIMLKMAREMYPANVEHNQDIVANIMYDVLYAYILKPEGEEENTACQEDFIFDDAYFKAMPEYEEMFNSIHLFVAYSRKGIKLRDVARALQTGMLFTLQKFKEYWNWKPLGFGSTAYVYQGRTGSIVYKQYVSKLRWTTAGHDNSDDIFKKELEMLLKMQCELGFPRVYDYLTSKKVIAMEHLGKSLYDNFKLPENWRDQIKELFQKLDKHGIYYPEFRLQNILVLNDRISFIDFGLATFEDHCCNGHNCDYFIHNLEILEAKLHNVENSNECRQLITTYLNNIKRQVATSAPA